MAAARRVRLRVTGTVQGVGFRPYVHALASELGVGGHVGNGVDGVIVEVEGSQAQVEEFMARLPAEAPALAEIESVSATVVRVVGDRGFRIAASTSAGGPRTALVSPDVAACDACLAEVADPADRRHGYAFTNCTNCGPRYTIIREVPYDRPVTTMAGFPMCAACAAEYHDPTDRRFHAQPTCCPACGPRLRLIEREGMGPPEGDAIAAAVLRLRAGWVVAVKGLGGYHLACDAGNEDAVAALRARKHREDKPFAVMSGDLDQVRAMCHVSDAEADLLTSLAAPIVLLTRLAVGGRAPMVIAPSVAPGNRSLGMMLPYTPLHRRLLDDFGGPLVLTSGNVSDEPIAHQDGDALTRLEWIADAWLTHDRPIQVRTDDSVARVMAGGPVILRRSRGYVPRPVTMSPAIGGFPRHVLAVGAELKSTVCVARDHHAFLSHHIGDLKNYETLRSFTTAINHLTAMFDVRTQVVAHDLHPEYLSTTYAREVAAASGFDLVGVQHHHAHIASCLADNGVAGPVIGVAFDGTGFGTDGTVWGGEILVADLADFERVGSLAPAVMPGGDAAVREPWRMALAHLDAAFAGEPPEGLGVASRQSERWDPVLAVARSGVNSPVTTSAGRLFDAVAALLGIRDEITYEGQAAIALEQAVDLAEPSAYPVTVDPGPPLVIRSDEWIRAVVDDLAAGLPAGRIAGRFHHAVADGVIAACGIVRDERGLDTVALSGGVFQNQLLVDRLVPALSAAGFTVLTHHQVPPNDGGIALGQAAVAAAHTPSADVTSAGQN